MFTVFENTKDIAEEVKRLIDRFGSDVLVVTVTTEKFMPYGNSTKTSITNKEMRKAKKVIVVIVGEKLKTTAEKIISYNSYEKDQPLSFLYDKDIKYKTEVFLTKDLIKDGCGGNCSCGNGGGCC